MSEKPYDFNDEYTHFDIHVYFTKNTPTEAVATDLQNQLKAKFPSMPVFPAQRNPVGPHPIGMWEGHITTKSLFSEVVPWLSYNHKGLSILVHPNARNRMQEGLLDHTERALWIGTPVPLDTSIFNRIH